MTDKKKVFAQDGICPVCHGDDIDYGTLEADFPTGVYFECTCNKCGATYNEWYDVELNGQYDITPDSVEYLGQDHILAEGKING